MRIEPAVLMACASASDTQTSMPPPNADKQHKIEMVNAAAQA
ncbi:hypothetical protein [Acinetobacter sp.]